MKELKKVWNKQYQSTEKATALKDRNFFNLEVKYIKKILLNEISKRKKKSIKILELGSGTGFLADSIVSELKKTSINCSYFGVDFSSVATKKAKSRKIPNSVFIKSDFIKFLKANNTKFDYIITQRSIMAIMNTQTQIQLLKLIKNSLTKGGKGMFSEVSIQAFKTIQKLRATLEIEPIEKVWHSLYLDEKILYDIFPKTKKIDFSSTYWFITRVIYPYFEKPKHNTKLHDFAASIPQKGNYGLVKLFVVQN